MTYGFDDAYSDDDSYDNRDGERPMRNIGDKPTYANYRKSLITVLWKNVLFVPSTALRCVVIISHQYYSKFKTGHVPVDVCDVTCYFNGLFLFVCML